MNDQNRKDWVVVRKSRTIPGGYRVIKTRLTEEQARAQAAWYKRPAEVMRLDELIALRMVAIANTRSPTTTKGEG